MPAESRRQILIGAGIIGAVGLLMMGCWFARAIPGEVGAWFSMVVGIFTSPFLMPVGFILLGFFVVNTLNAWRRHREGDEYVHLETAVGPGSKELPEHARSVAYRHKPGKGEEPSLLSRLEGALDIDDFDSAVEILSEMEDPERTSEPVIQLRIRLADSTGNAEQAEKLRKLLD